MVKDSALGVVTAHSWTRIHTLLVDAGTRPGTGRVDDTLGATLDVRIAKILR